METDLRDADGEDSIAQLFSHKQPKNLGRGGEDDCFAWSTVWDEYFSYPQLSRNITCVQVFFHTLLLNELLRMKRLLWQNIEESEDNVR